MDISFNCPNCNQELTADKSLAKTQTMCPTCSTLLTIPDSSVHVINPMASSAAAREERHFSVPVHDAPTEMLVQHKPQEVIAHSEGPEKTLHVKVIRRSDCVEVGKDRFEEIASDLFRKIGNDNIVSINPINYTHIDMATRQLLMDFGLIVVYRA